MKVLVAGEFPFAKEFGDLCKAAGHDTHIYLIEDFMDAAESGYMMDDLPQVDIAIEIHNESVQAKQELLMSLSYGIPDDALLLTSALPVSTTEAASWVPHSHRVVGFACMPPIDATSVFEIANGLQTSDAYHEKAHQFFESLGVEVHDVSDAPGLVIGRMIGMWMNEAIEMVREGQGTPKEIDRAIRTGANYAQGPLEWADYIGLDAVLGMMNGLHAAYGEKYRPSLLLRQMIVANRLGRKTGRGFYDYGAGSDEQLTA